MELITAAKNGDFNTVFNLLQRGHPANVRDHDNATPLYWSACHGHSSLCEVLIEGGSDVNARVRWGSTPLHAASDRGHIDCVKILLENGADVNCQNNRGDTPLHIAAYRGNRAIARHLLQARADTTITNDKGKTPQEEAVEGGHRETARCIDTFVSGRTQAITHSQNREVHQITPADAHIRTAIHNAPAFAAERTNGIYNPAVFRSLGSGNTSSLTASICSDSEATEFYGHTDSSMFCSVPENSRIDVTHGNLKRSISVGGHDTPRPYRHVTWYPAGPAVTKTNSLCNIPYAEVPNNVYENDINKSYSSADSLCAETSKLNMVCDPEVTRTPHIVTKSFAPDFSTKLTSNGRCVATESVDETQLEEEQMLRLHVPEMRSQTAALNRSLRASTGSVRDTATPSESRDSFIKTLQIQLVNAYKDIEKLTVERDDLKFKCSTVLNRLTDTEQMLEEKTKECEMLKDLVDTDRKSTAVVSSNGLGTGFHVVTEVPNEGILKLTDRLNNELPEITRLQKIMQENLLTLSQRKPAADLPETPNKEWVPGVDYVIVGENRATWLEPSVNGRVPLLVSFPVKHLKSGKHLFLKMLLILANPESPQWAFEPVLPNGDSAGQNCPWRPPAAVHQFEGSTERFKKFVVAPASKLVQLCGKTLFIVTYETKTFRTVLESLNRNGVSGVCPVPDYGSYIEFLVQVTYQVLSLISYLEERGIAHGNITEETVVMDKTLRPLLSDIEFALCGESSTWLPSCKSSAQLTKTECGILQTLTKGGRSSDFRSLCDLFHRQLVPDSASAIYLNAFDKDFRRKLASIQQVLQTEESTQSKAAHNCRAVLQRVGCILYGPRRNSVHSQKDCGRFLLSQILKMTTEFQDTRLQGECSDNISVQESVAVRRPELKAHFLCSISAEELWDVYQCCDRQNLLVS